MAIQKTYLDLVEVIKSQMGDVKTNATSRNTIESALAEISTKYGVGAAHKAYDSCKLESFGIQKPI
jgi:hypothetical protein